MLAGPACLPSPICRFGLAYLITGITGSAGNGSDSNIIASLRLPARYFLSFACTLFHGNDNNNSADTSRAVLGDLSDNFDNSLRNNLEDINKFRVKTRRIRLFNKFKT
ncbi:hypothetical protein A9G38_02475 [Gilliamella sp. Imp1-1]|nr:hypothetical protein A9G38_02475 [Gilliamella apicola]